MPRPRKEETEKRDRRLTVYLTEAEYDTVKTFAAHDRRAMTDVAIGALREWIERLINPPESWRKAKYERVMQEQTLPLKGFVCGLGHSFWIAAISKHNPKQCPMCGSENLKLTWGGTVHRGI